MPGGRQLFHPGARTRESRSPDPRRSHRMGPGRYHEKCRPDRCPFACAMVEGSVGLGSGLTDEPIGETIERSAEVWVCFRRPRVIVEITKLDIASDKCFDECWRCRRSGFDS